MTDVFISYARANIQIAETFKFCLEARGWDVWYDRRIRAGQLWAAQIENALKVADTIVVLWTNESIRSTWVIKEADYALQHGRLFGVCLDESEIPERFGEVQVANLLGWKGEESTEFNILCNDLARLVPPSWTEPFMIFFDWDKSTLTNEAIKVIKRAASHFKPRGKQGLHVRGYTDTSGSDEYNFALSMRRAEAVRDALVAEGVDFSSVTLSGQGKRGLLVPTPDGVRELKNRRAVIEFLKL